ncbi:uncharacterized protein SEPMUDRAFT_159545 [Sphaerulina musiva SO2202]|uniref:N-acetyltransferase domain-containing protein n=1 Tax=Sphaerulina musiva (strain SO2202) TaxID=692275 RepID=M3C7X0_SPHMS|nr:uncharacterized protein SEPMUDRAFT_159545 [Sphaerulina musiva SO2202]EMF07985.1 hypothetical protein SEPMUDRAFT_159545 [Sphaerulina musiva SO2202]
MTDTNLIKTIPGPQVDGRATTTSIFPTSQLTQSPFLPNLLSTINTAFRDSHALKPELGLTNHGERLSSTQEFLSALISDPESFVLIISYPHDSSTVLATASCRRYHGPPKDRPVDANLPWLRTLDVAPDTEEWELKLMATDVRVQGQGLAGYMMRTVEGEILERFQRRIEMGRESSGGVAAAGLPGKVKMVICTPMELMGGFYLRRGYTLDYQNWRGEGYNFHIAFMHKMIWGDG